MKNLLLIMALLCMCTCVYAVDPYNYYGLIEYDLETRTMTPIATGTYLGSTGEMLSPVGTQTYEGEDYQTYISHHYYDVGGTIQVVFQERMTLGAGVNWYAVETKPQDPRTAYWDDPLQYDAVMAGAASTDTDGDGVSDADEMALGYSFYTLPEPVQVSENLDWEAYLIDFLILITSAITAGVGLGLAVWGFRLLLRLFKSTGRG